MGEILNALGGNDNLQGNGGNDTLDGGAGADSLYGGAGDDVILYDALDRVQSAGTGADTLQVARGLTANLGAADQVSGDSGTASGFEHINAAASTAAVTLTGNAGANRLTGGQGSDTLTGGAGADRFVFTALADTGFAGFDQITDFAHLLDRIDLSAIDARAGDANNAFTFIGGAAFSANGQLRYDADTGLVMGDVNNDRQADFLIQLATGLTITAADFVL